MIVKSQLGTRGHSNMSFVQCAANGLVRRIKWAPSSDGPKSKVQFFSVLGNDKYQRQPLQAILENNIL